MAGIAIEARRIAANVAKLSASAAEFFCVARMDELAARGPAPSAP
jgi:hypothetical protein